MPTKVPPYLRHLAKEPDGELELKVEMGKNVRTLGFALAKGLIRGLTRCPNPSSKILTCYPFLDVS